MISKKLNQWLKQTDAFQILVQNNDVPDAFPIPPSISFEMSANDFLDNCLKQRQSNVSVG